MRKLLFGAALFTVASSLATARPGQPAHGQEVAVDADDVFVPAGFDDNDGIVMVVDGWLPNGCYRLTEPEVVVKHSQRRVEITPMARWFDAPCIEALVPYHFEVRLGVFPHGEYEVVVNDDQSVREALSVDEASNSGPDDHLYAPVDRVRIERFAGSGEYIAVISGRFTNSCLSWSEVRVINSGKTVEVLPMIEMQSGGDCSDGIFPYRKAFLLPSNMDVGRHLLHVRSLNGLDVNQMFSVVPD